MRGTGGIVPILVIIGKWERVAVQIEEIVGCYCKASIVISHYLRHIVKLKESQLAVGGREAPIPSVLDEGQRTVNGDAEIRDGINVLPWGAEDGNPVLARLVLLAVNSIDTDDAHFIDSHQYFIKGRPNLCGLQRQNDCIGVGDE